MSFKNFNITETYNNFRFHVPQTSHSTNDHDSKLALNNRGGNFYVSVVRCIGFNSTRPINTTGMVIKVLRPISKSYF